MPNLNVGLALVVCTTYDANAACSSTGSTSIVQERLMYSGLCINTDEYYYKNSSGSVLLVTSCKSCADGYYISDTSAYSSVCAATYSYRTCVKCPDCTNCTESEGIWSTIGSGRQQKVTTTCDCGTCKTNYSYRCAANYYGNGTTCTACPSYNGIAGTSSAGSSTVSSCCISSGSTYSFSDTIGSGNYKITSTCCAS